MFDDIGVDETISEVTDGGTLLSVSVSLIVAMVVGCSSDIEEGSPSLELTWAPSDESSGVKVDTEGCAGAGVVISSCEELEDFTTRLEEIESSVVELSSAELVGSAEKLETAVDC